MNPAVTRKPICVYADTSVYGGVFDEEFEFASRVFFRQVESGRFELIVSPIVELEIAGAPERVRAFKDRFFVGKPAPPVSGEVFHLQQAYLRAGIVGPQREADALHVAFATVAGCRMIVSWNFKHIVHYEKIALYNAINIVEGYPEIGIHTPQEVIAYEDQNV